MNQTVAPKLQIRASDLIGLNYGWGPLTAENAEYWASWHPASGHPKGWRVTRGLCSMEELEGKSGRRILFRSYEAAKLRADALNEKERLFRLTEEKSGL